MRSCIHVEFLFRVAIVRLVETRNLREARRRVPLLAVEHAALVLEMRPVLGAQGVRQCVR